MIPPLWLLIAAAAPARATDYALPEPPAVSTATTRLEFTADHLDYASTSTVLHLKGHVDIRESTWTIKADELWLDTRERRARSEGYVLVEDTAAAAAGTSGTFDFVRHTGTLKDPKAGFNQWRVTARSVTLSESRKLDYSAANFTSCDYIPPHYHFHATRLWVVPKKYLFARNVVFFLGPVPLFYSPFFYKSLKPTGFFRFKFQPGYDRRNGAFGKGTVLFDPFPHTYAKLFLDEYASQGFGHGAELQHRDASGRGAVYAYRIKETSTGRERWTMLGEGYQVARTSFSFQARGQVQSDADFNNDYARASLFRVTPELFNNGAVTYRMRRSQLRVSYARRDISGATANKFLKADESAPRLDFQTQSLQVWKLPWLNTFSGSYDNTFLLGRPFIQKTVNGSWEATRTVPLLRGVSLIPRAVYSETYYNRIDQTADFARTTTFRDAFIGRYTGQGTLRWQTPLGDWDLGHLYTARQKSDRFARDAGALDHGVEANITTLADAIRPNRKLLFRLGSGYDHRIFRDRSVGFRERVQPFVADVVYAPSSSLNFSLRDDYSLLEGNRSMVLNGQKGDERGDYLSLGFGYNRLQATQYFENAEFGFAPSSGTWRVVAALRSEAFSNGGPGRLSHLHVFEKEVALIKNWHDFYGRAQIRFRPGGVREVQLRAEIKFGGERPNRAPKRDWEAEWFPERGGPFVDRP